ncbi:LysM domain-containing protein [uncultured Roseovarius sp.]|uniref:LysM peptidoglycan-binding domain-containing protein n=1 Tax=uncultured Roseovarius sp. TaxID=293344 RepID=UPI00260235A6|nr:LysM domain-containing protein [uncultured Roseovarius sp.]
MLRVTLIAAGFFAVTLALILAQPGKKPPVSVSAPTSEQEVTRSGPDLASLNAPQPQSDPLMQSLSSTILPEDITPVVSPAPTQTAEAASASSSGETLEKMVLGALEQGQSEVYIDALVNDAAQKGRVDVPQSLVTAEGRVDTSLLLTALSQPARPRVPQTYTVATGDSLASIAYRFYGDIKRQADIVSANTDSLQPGNRLRVGQVLALPTPLTD